MMLLVSIVIDFLIMTNNITKNLAISNHMINISVSYNSSFI